MRLLSLLLSLLISQPALAMAKFYETDCEDLTGTWRGTYIDSGAYDGTVPVLFSLSYQDGIFSGKTQPINNSPVSFDHYTIGGSCKDKTIQLYFCSYYPQMCGVLSTGELLSHNRMKIDVKWENAMTGGSGPMTLERVDSTYRFDDLKFKFPKEVETCH